VLLNDFLDALLLHELSLVLLKVQHNLGSTTKRFSDRVRADGERSTGGRLPDVLAIITVLRSDCHIVGNEEGRVEAQTKLTNFGNTITSLHERLGAGLGVGSQVGQQISLCHAVTAVMEKDGKIG